MTRLNMDRLESVLETAAKSKPVRKQLFDSVQAAPLLTTARLLGVNPKALCVTDETILEVLPTLEAFYARLDESGGEAEFNLRVKETHKPIEGPTGRQSIWLVAAQSDLAEGIRVSGNNDQIARVSSAPMLHGPVAAGAGNAVGGDQPFLLDRSVGPGEAEILPQGLEIDEHWLSAFDSLRLGG